MSRMTNEKKDKYHEIVLAGTNAQQKIHICNVVVNKRLLHREQTLLIPAVTTHKKKRQ